MSRFLIMSDKFQYIMNNLQTQQIKGSMPNDEKPMSFKKDKITEKPAACPDATPRFEIKESSLAPGPFSARFDIMSFIPSHYCLISSHAGRGFVAHFKTPGCGL